MDIFFAPKSKKVPTPLDPQQVGKAKEAVEAALEAKRLMTYGKFFAYVTGKEGYLPSYTGKAVRLAEEAMKGSSALLVNSSGKYGKGAPVAEHLAFLAEAGFEVGE